MDQVFTAARNTRMFFIYRAVSRLYFYLPVLVLYFFVQGESFFKIGVLLCVYSLSVMVFEQPTSKLIEYFGAKRIIVFGEVLKACGLTLLVYGAQTSYSIIAQLLTGAGYALAAGGDASLMSRSLIDAEQQAKVQKKAHVIVLVCVITASVVGGVLAQLYGARTALLISIVPPLLAALSACLFIEPYTGKGQSPLTTTSAGYIWLARSPALLMSVLSYGTTRAIFMSMFVAFIPIAYLILFKVPLAVFGVVMGVYTVVSILTASYSTAICQRFGERLTVMLSYTFLTLAGGVLMYQGPVPQLLYLSPILMGFSAGITRPLAVVQFNRLTDLQGAGRSLTLGESVNAVVTLALILTICNVMDVYGVETGLVVLAASVATLAGLMLTCLYGVAWRNNTCETIIN